mmetsp:Transcript_33773/g.34410  ORF Transcript_33773/g.34410 Transcript_33773/m.34410 type:complete len:646 (-) Transcript_33773:151-2088(-)|eukprot:CAMPEP_0182424560 /NCGR_PEP_ID=MMETSP1167-20130531/10759_1 /TAXON_ID=2988 /ORGANISM="Mallomonas Sp, Strain CCMP3275" /LENGTH=645 /DNA_ID=CAMNT_0024604447 /DNA_START=304 /DNA_END=2241 /DNA_ORIENTATION=+
MSDDALPSVPEKSGGVEKRSKLSTPKSQTPKINKKDSQAVRADVRNYIRNERDTDLRKIMALNETLKLEDRRRNDFLAREIKQKSRVIPTPIQRFIKSLKQACKHKIVAKGGTPHGLIRQAFNYWDCHKDGTVGADVLVKCVASIGVRLSQEDARDVMQFYVTEGERMDYNQLLEDVLRDEPAVVAIPTIRETDRYEDPRLIDPATRTPPRDVQLFIEAVRSALADEMRDHGGTIESLLRTAFLMSDQDYSNGLDENELIRCVKGRLGLTITRSQARSVLNYYDTKGQGQINYTKLSQDVTQGHPQFIHHPELSARAVQASYKSLSKNPYVPKPFQPIANKSVEKFKKKLRESLETRIKAKGGSLKSWVQETFVKYDPKYTGTISDWSALQGAMRRLGIVVSEEEARAVMHCYQNGNGEVDYHTIVRDIIAEEGDLIESVKQVEKTSTTTSTARAPNAVKVIVKKIRAAVNPFGRKSKGAVNPRDILHGTFLRFDRTGSGRLNETDAKQALAELRVPVSDRDMKALISWYDTNGTNTMDYREITHQIFGGDPFIRQSSVLNLPKIKVDSNASAPASLDSSSSAPVLSLSSFISPVRDKYVKETKQQKAARAAFIRNQIINERALLQQKLHEVERQRKVLLDTTSS